MAVGSGDLVHQGHNRRTIGRRATGQSAAQEVGRPRAVGTVDRAVGGVSQSSGHTAGAKVSMRTPGPSRTRTIRARGTSSWDK